MISYNDIKQFSLTCYFIYCSMNKWLLFLSLLFFACNKAETIKPIVAPISESVYASGIIKSKGQYQAFAIVSGIVSNIFVSEGDSVKIGTPILSIANETQKLNKENAELAARFSDIDNNQGKLNEAQQQVLLSKSKLHNDSSLLARQRALWQQDVGTKVELEQRELAYQNSKTAYLSAIVQYKNLKRQLNFNSEQAKKNLSISSNLEKDFTVKSEINGTVFNILKEKGELVGPQTPLAIIGNPESFILEMQVDENDIFKLKIGLPVLVVMDSYKGKVFDARVSKIYPIMNERTKTFLVEAEFTDPPKSIFPNITFEASIVLNTKEKAVLIPIEYLVKDSMVIKRNGDSVAVKIGLRDYKQVEIISGVSADDELIKPK